MKETKKNKAIKKIEIAIDKMVDLQDDFSLTVEQSVDVQRILELLNSLENRVYSA